jgi:calcium-dependent protein kinase
MEAHKRKPAPTVKKKVKRKKKEAQKDGGGSDSDGGGSPNSVDIKSESDTGSNNGDKRTAITGQTAGTVSGAFQCIIENQGEIGNFYNWKKTLLGKGTFGSVRIAAVKASGAKRAVKTIEKKDLKNSVALTREIKVLKLIDHLHIVKLYETFEDDEKLYLVMALSTHGHLAKYVANKGQLSVARTRTAMRDLVSAINYLHYNGIIHRDVKPENVLIHEEYPLSLRLTDFGIARRAQPNQVFTSVVGSPSFMAPEVFKKKYTLTCDVWGYGISMYYLLCGYLPFTGESIEEIKNKILKEPLTYESKEWVDVDQATLGFLDLMTKKNPRVRYTADQTFHHDWLRQGDSKGKESASSAEVTADMIKNLRNFRKGNKLKRSALIVIASMLKTNDVREAHEVFVSCDINGDGQISMAEMRQSLEKKVGEEEVQQMFEHDLSEGPASSNLDDEEDAGAKPFAYTEFIAATFNRKKYITKSISKAAFAAYDKDGDGRISMAELAQGQLLGHLSMEEMAQTLEDLDGNGDCFIDLQEFREMLLV